MRRMFWLGIGVVTGVTLTRKARETARQATPAGLASNVSDAVRELGAAIGAFGADVRAGMSEREQELSDIVEQRSGMPRAETVRGRNTDGRHAASESRVRRARPAGS